MFKKIKRNKRFSSPVVIHTTSNKKNHFISEDGFDDYILKPVSKDNLTPILEKFLIYNRKSRL